MFFVCRMWRVATLPAEHLKFIRLSNSDDTRTPQAFDEKVNPVKFVFVSKRMVGGEMSPMRIRLEWERDKIC